MITGAEKRKLMDTSLKAIVVPELRKMGFSGSYPNFRIVEGDLITTCAIQFNRYGGSFILEFARNTMQELTPYMQSVVVPAKAVSGDLSNRYRLGATKATRGDFWFDFENFSNKKSKYDELAKEVVNKLLSVEGFFRYEQREVGDYLPS